MERSSLTEVPPPEHSEVAQAFHIANFVPAHWGIQDPISRSLVGFQHGIEPETTQWIRLVLQGTAGLPSADLIIRALSAAEAAPAPGTPLDRLGREIAAKVGGKYEPNRLGKVRPTRPVKRAGIRGERDRILAGAYRFDGEGVHPTGSILIIDDCVTTGATFGAIASAIRAVVPSAVIRYLALGRTDPWLVRLHLGEEYSGSGEAYRESLVGNAHLDERYFTGSSPTAERRRQASAPSQRRAQGRDFLPPVPLSGGEVKVFGDEEGDQPRSAGRDPSPESLAPKSAAVPPAESQHRSAGRGPTVRQTERTRTVLTAAGVLALIVVAFLLTRTGSDPVERRSPIPAPQAPAFVPPASPAPERERPRARTDTRPRGIINVPNVGLRMEASITSPSVEGVMVTEGERVILLRSARGEVGPEWILVETARGIRGWVIAPVVTRLR